MVVFKDRIVRFGYELFELLCKEHSCAILIYSKLNLVETTNEIMDEQESDLKDDLLSVINVFVASNNGRKAAFLKKERKRIKQESNEEKELDVEEKN